MRKKFIFFTIIGAVFFLGYDYLFPEHRSIQDEPPRFSLEANLFFNEFEANSKQAETKYLDQTISVIGVVTSVNPQNLTINRKIFCKFENTADMPKLKDSIQLKGRCIGYDDLLEEIKLDKCSIIK